MVSLDPLKPKWLMITFYQCFYKLSLPCMCFISCTMHHKISSVQELSVVSWIVLLWAVNADCTNIWRQRLQLFHADFWLGQNRSLWPQLISSVFRHERMNFTNLNFIELSFWTLTFDCLINLALKSFFIYGIFIQSRPSFTTLAPFCCFRKIKAAALRAAPCRGLSVACIFWHRFQDDVTVTFVKPPI